MRDLIFLKLGGSLITDKTAVEKVRGDVLARLAAEIKVALESRPALRLVLGHGSGSYGHIPAAQYGTREGVKSPDQWEGFAQVAATAARLNAIVRQALLEVGVAAVTVQPSSSAVCEDGQLASLALRPIQSAIDAGLVPLLYGDVAFDTVRGGTIISTEQIFAFLTPLLRPSWLLLAGDMEGVLDQQGAVISRITPESLDRYAPALGQARGTDVTGGMSGKVRAMLALANDSLGPMVRIFSGLENGRLRDVVMNPVANAGTLITCSGP